MAIQQSRKRYRVIITTISPEQILGAMCADHKYIGGRFKMAAVVECDTLEFFYDGLKQIYINKQAATR